MQIIPVAEKIKYLPEMVLFSNLVTETILMCSVNFRHQQNSNLLFKWGIGHVLS